jgi:hypothetical protein
MHGPHDRAYAQNHCFKLDVSDVSLNTYPYLILEPLLKITVSDNTCATQALRPRR